MNNHLRFFFTSLRLEVRHGLFSRVTAIFLTVLLLGIFSAHSLFAGNPSDIFSARVAIVHEAGDKTAGAVAAALPLLEGISFAVLQSPHPDELSRMVAAGELECAYLIPADLKDRVMRGDIHGAVEVLTSPGTVITALTDKWVFTAIIETLAPEITAFELAAILDIPADEILPDILQGFGQYAEGHRFVAAETSWSGGGGEHNQSAPGLISAGRLLHGIIALAMLGVMFVWLPGYLLAKDKMRSVLRPLNLCIYYSAVCTALFLRILLVGAAGTFAVVWLIGGDLKMLLPALAAYALFCAVLGILLVFILRTGGSVFTVGVFTILCCVLLGGVIIDPAELGGVFVFFSRALPTAHYINLVI
ncbi:MAG: hypothetical protein FWH00_02280 [Oscillospiraceae bacterium]|nr:hypothetical protein [Oscillospiraceae bacterium]